MSVMNCAAAMQAVLDEAFGRMSSLIVIQVDAEAEPASLSRRVTLPLDEDAGLGFALGCAQAGLTPMLDLSAVRDAGERLEKAFAALPAASLRPLTIRLSARRTPALAGARVIAPADARQCAGALRYALQSGEVCVIVENPLAAFETCEVPNDPDELFTGEAVRPADAAEPVDGPERAEPAGAPFETGEAGGVETPYPPAPRGETRPTPVLPPTPIGAPVPRGELAYRGRAYDPAELTRTAELLSITRDELAALCCARAAESAEVILETDSEPGETAFIPPEKSDACLWVGRDRLTLCWNPRALSVGAARALIGGAAQTLALPARLILDRKV